MTSLLSQIQHPHDVKNLALDELHALAAEIRQRILEVVDRNGGHLGSNLGAVELTLALHRVFDLPRDRLVWDVSHQTYPHKLLTGRRDRFHTIRQFDGICGFCNKRESVYDLFDAGHAGTAISLALGVAAGDHLQGERRKTIAVVGDAAIAAGMAIEGLNHAGELKRDFLVVLNDNNMSIDRAVGALSMYFNRLRTRPIYHGLKKEVHEILSRIPVVGKRMENALDHVVEMVKHSFVPGLLFQELGFNYYGPTDGHNLPDLIRTFEDLARIEAPVLLHLKTVKGQGYSPAAADPIAYHAPKNFMAPKKDAGADDKPKVEAPPITYSQLFGDTIVESARRDRRIVAVTAAMPGGTGLGAFAKEFPARYFDVGICEQHGGAFSSGLSYSGLRPVYAVYSTFCQRAYDQFVHDVCIQENSVIFCLDRAGLVEDGWTHHGVFDIAYMRCVPNVILMAPRDGAEFRRMFAFALEQSTAPVAIRYPRAELPLHLPAAKDAEIEPGKAEVLLEGEDVAVFAYGSMVEVSFQAALKLRQRGVEVTVVNGRFAKPLDVEILRQLSVHHHTLITAEEHALMGGFGSAVLEALGDQGIIYDRTVRLGIPDRFITYGNRKLLLRECGLDVDGVEAAIENALDAPRRAPERVRALPDAELLPRPSRSGR